MKKLISVRNDLGSSTFPWHYALVCLNSVLVNVVRSKNSKSVIKHEYILLVNNESFVLLISRVDRLFEEWNYHLKLT